MTVAAGLGGLLGGYLLSEVRRRRLESAEPPLPPVDAMTVGDYERLSGQRVNSIVGNIGALRREVANVTQHIAGLEVTVKDAIGEAKKDRALAREERALSDDLRQRMHTEVLGLHRAIDGLTKAASDIPPAVKRLEQILS